jgi:hypothetical protein
MWIEPATPAIHPIPASSHWSRSTNAWLAWHPLLFYETSSWQDVYCSCALHFWKYANMQTWKYERYKYDRMKEEKMRIRKSIFELMWIEPSIPATSATHLVTSHHFPFQPTHTYPVQTIPGSLDIPFCFIEHLPDGMHTVHVRFLFWKYANIEIGNV